MDQNVIPRRSVSQGTENIDNVGYLAGIFWEITIPWGASRVLTPRHSPASWWVPQMGGYPYLGVLTPFSSSII